jgi:hypothetical protein
MSSRDFDFLTLRNLIAYQPNGARVPPNYILTVSTNGIGVFSNVINPSTVNANTINTNLLDANIISAGIYFGSTIECNNLLAYSSIRTASTITSTLNVTTLADISSLFADLANISSLNAESITASTAQVSSVTFQNANISSLTSYNITSNSISTNIISANTIGTHLLNTHSISSVSTIFMSYNNLVTELSTDGTDLFINGFPALTEGNISSISSLYWEDTLGTAHPGAIFNKNVGTTDFKYMVGIGTDSTLNGTLSVKYAGTVTGNAFHVSSYNNTFAIKNISSASLQYMTGQFINNQNDTFGSALEFVKTKNFGETTNNSELGYIDFYGLNSHLSTARGAYILARQTGPVSTFTTTDLQFLTCTSSTNAVNMVINSQGNVGIGLTSPQQKLDVSGNIRLNRGENSTVQLIMGPTPSYGNFDYTSMIEANNNFTSNFGSDLRFYTHSTGMSEGVTQERMRIDKDGNIGIGLTSPQQKLDVNGNIRLARGENSTVQLIMGPTPSYGNFDYTSMIEANNNFTANFGSDLRFYTHSTGMTEGATQERMRIDKDGNIGVGTPTPYIRFQTTVASTTAVSGIAANSFDVNTILGAYSQGSFGGQNVGSIQVTRNFNTLPISTYTLALNPIGGNVYIGSTTSNLFIESASTIAKELTCLQLNVTSSISTNIMTLTSGQLIGISSINGLAYPPIDDALWSASGNNIYNDNIGNVGIGTTTPTYKLHVSGDIYASGNVTAGSDERMKTNINTIQNALSTVNNLRGVSYFLADKQIKNIGVIAQEVEKVLPEVVLTDNSPQQLKSVAYGNIVGLLIEAIKELSRKIEFLENKSKE